MKKLFPLLALVLMLACTIGASLADDFDLSGLSFDELVVLKDRLNLAIWNSEEWQEVTVPQGRWIVGEDIPAGKWTIKCADVNRKEYLMSLTFVEWGEYLADDGDISFDGRNAHEFIYNPKNENYEKGSVTELTFEFFDGDIVDISADCAPAVFTPYAGKPSLGFK